MTKKTPTLADVGLRALWTDHMNRTFNPTWATFVHSVELVTSAKEAARVRRCLGCRYPHDQAQMHEDPENRAVWACEACWVRFFAVCYDCEQRRRNMTTTIYGHSVCQVCMENTYTFCRNCNGLFRKGEEADHRHGADGCCVSPALEFVFPLFSGESITNDERVEVEVEAGKLSPTGEQEVVRILGRHARALGDIYVQDGRPRKMYTLANAVPRLVSRDVKGKDGTYTTRLKKAAYKEFGLKIDPNVLTSIGNVVSRNSLGGSYAVELTRDLNLPPAEFANTGSCFWTEHAKSRCQLKTNGGMGLRSFDGKKVTGRAWVYALKAEVDGRLRPTFDTDTGIFLTYNGYGRLADLAAPQVIQAMVGSETYARVRLNDGSIYMNTGTACLVGPSAVVEKFVGHGLLLTMDEHSNLYTTEMKEKG